jgi:uncharacterized membrane-anchored protein
MHFPRHARGKSLYPKEHTTMDDRFSNSDESSDSTASRKRNADSNWILGAALLLVGVIFLLNNLTGWKLANWWMVFLLIPALGSFATAWRRYRDVGRSQRRAVIRPVVMGLILVLLMVVLLFELKWQIFLSMLLILAGVVALLGALL